MTVGCLTLALLVSVLAATGLPAQSIERDDPGRMFERALHLADLYNWSDAAPWFNQAEQLYEKRGDRRNAFYAHLGAIRSTMEQRSLPEVSEELGNELEQNPLLQSDQELRRFCLVVRGDVDAELDSEPMRRDWEAVLKLARDAGDKEWENRASGEIGLSMFLEGEVAEARQRVSRALLTAMLSGDRGAQIRYLTAIGHGLVLLGSPREAFPFLDKALKLAADTPDSGYPFMTYTAKLQGLEELGDLVHARKLADEIRTQARARQKYEKEAQVLILASTIDVDRHDRARATRELRDAVDLAQAGGFKRLLADAQFLLADIYRGQGALEKAEQWASAAAEATKSGGDVYLLPQRLLSLAKLEGLQGKYRAADATYDRASDILDTMIGNVRSTQAKIGLITSMSEVYRQHFALAEDHLHDSAEAYSIVERARGRAVSDLLLSGRPPDSPAQEQIEREISRLNVALSRADSADQVRSIRDQIFRLEQGRWAGSATGPWQLHTRETIPLARLRETLGPDELMLEYVVGDRRSYCLVITREGARIVALAGRETLEPLIDSFVKHVKGKQPATIEARELDRLLLKNVPEARRKQKFIIVPDDCLHWLPFDALVDPSLRYLIYSRTITYAPSATAWYLLRETPDTSGGRSLLGVGGIPYDQFAELNQLVRLRGYASGRLTSLPGSKDEVLAIASRIENASNSLLIGAVATESAFKRADLEERSIIHLAVHGVADEQHPQRAALILASDAASGEDGLLEADEILRLRLNADLVVLSACDTAVGRLQGEEGIANLSRAFLLAGARSVVSTLWTLDDTAAPYLMKRFYGHLAEKMAVRDALRRAKLDMLRTYGASALPYYWAGFKLEGLGSRPVTIGSEPGGKAITRTHSSSAVGPSLH